MESKKIAVGIDFGTTSTVAVIMTDGGSPQPLRFDIEEAPSPFALPSVVFFLEADDSPLSDVVAVD